MWERSSGTSEEYYLQSIRNWVNYDVILPEAHIYSIFLRHYVQYPKKTLILALVLPLILSLLVGSNISPTAVAVRQHSIFKTNGISAIGTWPSTGFFLAAVKDQFGTEVFATRETPDGTELADSGNILANVFQVTNNLGTATLSPVTLKFCIFDFNGNCIKSEFLTIKVTWTAIASPFTNPNSETFTGRDFSVHFTGISTNRLATATGTFDSQNLGQSNPGAEPFPQTAIVKFRSAEVDTFGQ
jgi:hypothetical protein